MSLHDDLLEQAQHLATRDRTRPKQASLRRAVSTGYYALFHRIIAEATFNWKRAAYRDALARVFEHGRMKSACTRQAASSRRTADAAKISLGVVAEAFVKAQQKRHLADYDHSKA